MRAISVGIWNYVLLFCLHFIKVEVAGVDTEKTRGRQLPILTEKQCIL